MMAYSAIATKEEREMTDLRHEIVRGRRWLALLCCAAFALSALATTASRARAAETALWTAQSIAAAPDGTTRLLWTAQITAGQVVSIWKLDSAGKFLAASQTYGPFSDSTGSWTAEDDMAVAPSGALNVVWRENTNIGPKISIWTFDSNLNKVSVGPTYGPYVDTNGKWLPTSLVEAGNGSTYLMWTKNVNGAFAASIWSLNSSGTATAMGPAYGPFTDNNGSWYPQQLRTAPDGSIRLMWMNSNNAGTTTEVSFWTLTSAGVASQYSPTYGPYSDWRPLNFWLNPIDSTLHMVWSNDSNVNVPGDAMSAWSLTTTGTATSMGQVYGPYSNWRVYAIVANRDSTSRVVWTEQDTDRNDIAISVWTLNGANQQIKTSPTYGPFAGWTLDTGSFDPFNSAFRLLWQRSDQAASTWSLDYSGTATALGPAQGPYTYTH